MLNTIRLFFSLRWWSLKFLPNEGINIWMYKLKSNYLHTKLLIVKRKTTFIVHVGLHSGYVVESTCGHETGLNK